MELVLTIVVPDKVTAYQITTKVNFENEVISAEIDGDKYKFDKKNPSKAVNKFLRDDFGK